MNGVSGGLCMLLAGIVGITITLLSEYGGGKSGAGREDVRSLWLFWEFGGSPDVDRDSDSSRLGTTGRREVVMFGIGVARFEKEDTATLARLGSFLSFPFPLLFLGAATTPGCGGGGVTNSIITSVESAGKTSAAGTGSPSVRVSFSIFWLRWCAPENDSGWLELGWTGPGSGRPCKRGSAEDSCMGTLAGTLGTGFRVRPENREVVLEDGDFGATLEADFDLFTFPRGLGFLGGAKSKAEYIAVGERGLGLEAV